MSKRLVFNLQKRITSILKKNSLPHCTLQLYYMQCDARFLHTDVTTYLYHRVQYYNQSRISRLRYFLTIITITLYFIMFAMNTNIWKNSGNHIARASTTLKIYRSQVAKRLQQQINKRTIYEVSWYVLVWCKKKKTLCMADFGVTTIFRGKTWILQTYYQM